MLISSSLLGLLVLSSASVATFATRGPPAAQQERTSSGDRGRDPVTAGRRIIHVPEESGFVNDRVLQTDGQRTEYPKASVAGIRSEASRGTGQRDTVNNNAASSKNSVLGSFSSGEGKKGERIREQYNQNQRISTNDRSQGKSDGSNNSKVNTFTSDTSTSSNAGTKSTQSLRIQGYSRTGRNFQNAALSSGGSRLDTNYRALLNPGHGHLSPTPLDLHRASFSCQGRGPGYYADTEADCQVFHVCGPEGGQHSFVCPSGTVFNQRVLVCDWWFKFECSRAPQLYNKGNKTPEDDLKSRNTLSELSRVTGNSNEGIEPGTASGVTASNPPPLGLSVGDVGQQTLYGRAARRLRGGTSSKEGPHGVAMQIPGPFGSENTELTIEQNVNNNFESLPQSSSNEHSILLSSELENVSDVGIDSDGEIFFISDDITNDNSLVIDTLNSKETSGAFQQNREPAGDAQRSLGTSLFKARGITGFVPSYAFPLMANNTNLFSVLPAP